MANCLGRARARSHPRRARSPQVLCPVHVPLSFGQPSCRPYPQLRDYGRNRAAETHAGLSRTPTPGMGCFRFTSGECGNRAGRASSQVDLSKHCPYEGAVAALGTLHRLGAGSGHLFAGLLQMDAMDLPAIFPSGLGLPEGSSRELGSG